MCFNSILIKWTFIKMPEGAHIVVWLIKWISFLLESLKYIFKHVIMWPNFKRKKSSTFYRGKNVSSNFLEKIIDLTDAIK